MRHSTSVTIQIKPEVAMRLKKLSTSIHCPTESLAAEAIEEYLDLHEWQVQAIQEGLNAAERSEVIDFSEVKKYWEKKFANSAH